MSDLESAHLPADALPSDALTAPPIDEPLLAELPTFEAFFKTFGFKRVHGRVWGLLVLSDRPLASREISEHLEMSQGATSTALKELADWGAIATCFDSSRRCHLHSPVGNAIHIVATVFRRREQVVFEQFKQTAGRALVYISTRHGKKDPRVMTLRSIITTCELAEAVMQLVFSAVTSALGDSQSLLSKAIQAALKIGVGQPASRLFAGSDLLEPTPSARTLDADDAETHIDAEPSEQRG